MQYTEYSEIDFQKYWLVLKRRWFPALGTFGIVLALAVVNAFQEIPIYRAEGKLVINKEDASSSLTGLEYPIGRVDSLTFESDPLSTQVEIINSRPIAQQVIDTLNLKDDQGELLTPKDILGSLQAEPIEQTDVIVISYEDEDPQKAAAIVNQAVDAYVETDLYNNRAEAIAASEFLAEQLPEIEAKAKQAEEALRQFKEENQVVVLEEEAIEAVGVIANLEEMIAQAQSKLAEATAKAENLRNQIGFDTKQALAASSLSESIGVQEAREELQRVQTELASQRTRFREENPTIITLKEQEAALQNILEERIEQTLGSQQQLLPSEHLHFGGVQRELTKEFIYWQGERLGLAQELEALLTAQSAYKERTRIMPQLEKTQSELQRQLELAQSTYGIYLNKLQEAQVAENQNIGNVRVISKAEIPEKPLPSNKKVVIAVGGSVGILLGIAVAFLLDLVDSSVKTVKEAKELLGSTLLGVIPDHKRPGKASFLFRGWEPESVPKVFVGESPRSLFDEAYQMLQANLKFLSSDKALKAVVVTSSVPREGKSEVSANLAAAMAQVGRRVLLVDADLRHPCQHHIWQLTNAVGLSNVLVGEAEFNSSIQQVMPGLDVLPSGVIPPNPVALLDSKRMASLIEMFSNNYDAVIIDTPPLAGIADAPILGKMADGILLVVRPGVVDAKSAKSAKEFLARANQNILGLVANGVVLKNEPDSYFYFTKEEYRTQDSSGSQEPIQVGM